MGFSRVLVPAALASKWRADGEQWTPAAALASKASGQRGHSISARASRVERRA
jgi:hypothetical protein